MLGMAARQKKSQETDRPYLPPKNVQITSLGEALMGVRDIPENQQARLGIADGSTGFRLWYAGDLSLIYRTCVAVVGARRVSPAGAARARRLARELVEAGIVVVSGLAYGIDTEALTAAIEAGGKTIAVIGTPIDKASPAANRRLQERIYEDHLLISQFPSGKPVFAGNFPERNKLMAAICDATVIIEASDTSGSLHQAAECLKLNRWLFICRSILDDHSLNWPSKFLHYQKTKALTSTNDMLEALGVTRRHRLGEPGGR